MRTGDIIEHELRITRIRAEHPDSDVVVTDDGGVLIAGRIRKPHCAGRSLKAGVCETCPHLEDPSYYCVRHRKSSQEQSDPRTRAKERDEWYRQEKHRRQIRMDRDDGLNQEVGRLTAEKAIRRRIGP